MITVELTKSKEYLFKVTSKTGNTLLKSIPFSKKNEIEKTVAHLASNNKVLQKVERKTNFEGKFLFHLKSESGQLLGTSGLYSSEAGMENGIKNLWKSLEAD